MSADQRVWIRANARIYQWVDLDAVEADLEDQFGIRIQGTGPTAVIRNGATITSYKGAWDQNMAAVHVRVIKLAPPPAGATRLTVGMLLVPAIARSLGMPAKSGGQAYHAAAAFIEAQ